MPLKLLTLVGLLPCAIAFFTAKLLGANKLREGQREVSKTGAELADLILKGKGVRIKKKRSWWNGLNPHKQGVMYMSEQVLERKTLGNAAEVIHRCGLVLLEGVHEKSVKKHYKVVRFVSIVPILLIVASILARVAGRLSFNICLTIAVWGVALACIACLFNIFTGREAVKRALRELDKKGGIKRLQEKEDLEEAAFGYVCLLAVPPLFAPLVKWKR